MNISQLEESLRGNFPSLFDSADAQTLDALHALAQFCYVEGYREAQSVGRNGESACT